MHHLALCYSLHDLCESELFFTDSEIQDNDRYIVIASDGVFEFITNQKTADMVADVKDPLQGCLAVADEAYEMWFLHEDRTDDITIIVIELHDNDSESSPRSYTTRRRVSRPDFEQKRPRRSMIGNVDEQTTEDGEVKKGVSLLSPDEVHAAFDDEIGGEGEGDAGGSSSRSPGRADGSSEEEGAQTWSATNRE